jgi:phosphate/sulfate permease
VPIGRANCAAGRHEERVTFELSGGSTALLVLALALACAFEFVNGFHDTANAVATVIYTNALKPYAAVVWSGICNFLGVFLGGIAVALSIIHLLPFDLLIAGGSAGGLAMVFALLLAAILWNVGTWYLGLPASSSHTLIGAILGVGVANGLMTGTGIVEGVHWGKALEVALSLLLSPLLGFLLTCATRGSSSRRRTASRRPLGSAASSWPPARASPSRTVRTTDRRASGSSCSSSSGSCRRDIR